MGAGGIILWRRESVAFGGDPLGGGRERGRLVLGAHGERSEPKSDRHQATERGGRGFCANVVPSCSKQGMVANVVPSCSKQGMVANVVPSCSKQGMVAYVVTSCSKQGMVAYVVTSCSKQGMISNVVPSCSKQRSWRGRWWCLFAERSEKGTTSTPDSDKDRYLV